MLDLVTVQMYFFFMLFSQESCQVKLNVYIVNCKQSLFPAALGRGLRVFDLVQCKKGKQNMFLLGFLHSYKATDITQKMKRNNFPPTSSYKKKMYFLSS